MQILSANVENHDGWTEATITVTEDGHVAVVAMEWDWEDRDGSTELVCAQEGFKEGTDLCDRIYATPEYQELVESKLPTGDDIE